MLYYNQLSMSKPFTIILGADHAGFRLKEVLKSHLINAGYIVEDVTPVFRDGDDYPPIAQAMVKRVLKGDKGILICDTGAGMAIAVNRFKKIRAVPCYSELMARHARTDNDSNILCLGQETTPVSRAIRIVDLWLVTPFSKAARHTRRIKQLG